MQREREREREREVRNGNDYTIAINSVYAPGIPCRAKHRRIISLFDGRVFYSTGGNRNRDCLEKTMQRWIKRYKAELIHEAVNR